MISNAFGIGLQEAGRHGGRTAGARKLGERQRVVWKNDPKRFGRRARPTAPVRSDVPTDTLDDHTPGAPRGIEGLPYTKRR